MMNGSFRCYSHIRYINSGVIAFTNNGVNKASPGHQRNYAQDKGGCCKDTPQHEGKKIEQWPKPDPPPPAWRCECPYEPQPPNYDPYRIKVPDVMVPPLPPSNAKWLGAVLAQHGEHGQGYPHQQGHGQYPPYGQQYQHGQEQVEQEEEPEGFFGYLKKLFRGGKKGKGDEEEISSEDGKGLFQNSDINFEGCLNNMQDLFQNSPIIHPDYWKDKPEKRLPHSPRDIQEPLPKLGYHGKHKYMYAFHEPWKPHDRLSLLAQAEKEELDQSDATINTPNADKQVSPAQSQSEANNVLAHVIIFQRMIDCTRVKGPCTVKPVPDPPPCPPPPPPPFPWIYVWSSLTFLGVMGLLYKLYLWRELQEKLGRRIDKWRPRRKIKRPFSSKDLPACVQYLIVGTGAAGWAAYRAIMEHDKTAKVFFITKEDCIPYIQPPMSKHMWWNPEPPDIKTLNYIEDGKRHTMYLAQCEDFLDPIKFYRKKKGPAVSIATGWCVLRVDADDHVVWVKTLCGEQPIYYERCLLAPGAKAKNLELFKSAPKEVRDRVCTLRTIRDLEIAYRKVKDSKHVVIIGGGLLGCELAWYLGRMNKVVERPEDEDPIHFVHMIKDKGILAGVLPEYVGEWAAEKIKCEGVTVMPKTQVYDAFPSPDGRLELTLSNGSSLVTDYVLVAVGTQPREELAEPSFLELDKVNGGFLVNTELEARTHLYVAGDAASFYSQWKDTRLRLSNYGNAEEQGHIAGANMTGYWTPCNMEPHFELILPGALEIEGVGEVGACMPTVGIFKPCTDEVKPQEKTEDVGDGDRPCYKKSDEYKNRYKRGLLFYLRDETVVGMVFWNMPPVDDRYMVSTEILRARPNYKEISMLAGLLGFDHLECDYLSEEQLREPGPCIKNRRFP